LAYEQAGLLGGDHIFGKATVSYAWHKTLYTDVEDRKSVLTLRARGGAIIGDAPVFERFYAGGIGSLRGFEFRGVSPRDGLKDYRVGGNYMLLAGAEYSFPLYADVIRGVFFTDQGTVEEDFEITGWRASMGFGIRMQVDFFGPVPLEFDFAVPVLSESDDDEQVFSFFIGTVF
jgi:outer membrane protein insertion porin family